MLRARCTLSLTSLAGEDNNGGGFEISETVAKRSFLLLPGYASEFAYLDV